VLFEVGALSPSVEWQKNIPTREKLAQVLEKFPGWNVGVVGYKSVTAKHRKA